MSNDSVVLVVGGASGIGKAVASAFYAQARKVAVIDLNAARDAALASVHWEQADVSDFEAVSAAIKNVERMAGPIGVLVNSAGVLEPASIADASLGSWRRQIDINLGGVFHACKEVAPLMKQRRAGTIVNVASRLGLMGRPNHGAYAASKFGIVGLTQCLALELAPFGIRVNAVCPGPIDGTGMHVVAESARAEPERDERTARIPLGRFGRPEEVADLVQFLSSDRASYITGQAVAICGGLSIV